MNRTLHGLLSALALVTCVRAQSNMRPTYFDRAIIQHTGAVMTITANSPVPLFQAVSALREEYGWQINFERAPGYSRFDVVDDTGPKWRAGHPGAKGVTRPSGGLFTSTVPEVKNGSDSGGEHEVLVRLLDQYNSTANPGKYVLIADSDGQFTVMGNRIRNEGGAIEQIAPVLDTPVTIATETRTIYDTVAAILQALSKATGKKAIMMSVPNNTFERTQASIGGTNVPARQLLKQALASTHRPLQYDLGYDPDGPIYLLNVSVAAMIGDNGLGGATLSPIDNPRPKSPQP